jgi:hypothetical protein
MFVRIQLRQKVVYASIILCHHDSLFAAYISADHSGRAGGWHGMAGRGIGTLAQADEKSFHRHHGEEKLSLRCACLSTYFPIATACSELLVRPLLFAFALPP